MQINLLRLQIFTPLCELGRCIPTDPKVRLFSEVYVTVLNIVSKHQESLRISSSFLYISENISSRVTAQMKIKTGGGFSVKLARQTRRRFNHFQ